MNRNRKFTFLVVLLIVTLSLIIVLTVKGVSIGEVRSSSQKLSNVEYLGVTDKHCYRMACTGILQFKSEDNLIQLTGHKHEIETLYVGSKYDVYYDNYSKTIVNYEISN